MIWEAEHAGFGPVEPFFEAPQGSEAGAAVVGPEEERGDEEDLTDDQGEGPGGESREPDRVKNSEQDLVLAESCVIRRTRPVEWKEHRRGTMQSTSFFAEWRSSAVTDSKEFVRGLLLAVGTEASFIVGYEVRKHRADYAVVVRTPQRLRWRDPRKELLFGHGAVEDDEDFHIRIRVPVTTGTDKGINAFVARMTELCDRFDNTHGYKEKELIRQRSNSFPRPGRTRKGVESGLDL